MPSKKATPRKAPPASPKVRGVTHLKEKKAKTKIKTKIKTTAKAKPQQKQSIKSVKKAASAKSLKPTAKSAAASVPKQTVPKVESSLMIQGAKFVKVPFFFDVKEDNANKRRYIVHQKLPEKPTACSRPKINGHLDAKNLVEFLSQQLEYENRTYFEGCEGQICAKCNVNNVDAKFYVDKSLGYCIECATLLNLGQSKEGVFSDAQMELMRRSMEKSMENVKDIDENDIESALGDMDSLELEETLLAVEEAADFNV